MHKSWIAGVAALSLVVGGALASAAGGPAPRGAAAVDSARQLAADKEPGTWMSAGRTYDEQRYSPLTGIDKANVSKLGLTSQNFADRLLSKHHVAVVPGIAFGHDGTILSLIHI